MTALVPSQQITTPVGQTNIGSASGLGAPQSLSIVARFAYGSGGQSVDAYVQTTLDGNNWFDIANFHLTTVSGNYVSNVYTQKGVANGSLATGSIAANTTQDGLLGSNFRCMQSSLGTYASTSLSIDIFGRG